MQTLSARSNCTRFLQNKQLSFQRFTQQQLLPALYTIGLAGFGVVSFLPEMMDIGSRKVTIPFRAFVLGLVIIVLLHALHARLVTPGWGLFMFMLFWMLYLTRMLNDTYLFPVPLARSPETYFLFGVGVSMVPALAFFTMPGSAGLRRAMIGLYLTMSGIMIAGMLHGFRDFVLTSRLSGNQTYNPISIGHVGASICILSLFIYMTSKTTKKVSLTLFTFIMLALGLTTVALSASRASILSIAVIIMPFLIWALMKRRNRLRVTLLVVVLVIFTPILINKTNIIGGSLVGRIDKFQHFDYIRNNIRYSLWSEGWRAFLDNPLFGSSLDIPQHSLYTGYPHSILIEGFMTTGIVGGLLLVAISGYGLIAAIRLIRLQSPAGWVGLLYIQYLIAAMSSGTLYTNVAFWYLYAGVVATSQAFSSNRKL